MNKINIQSNIDIVRLFDNFEVKYSHHIGKMSSTDILNLKDAMLLFLHFLTPDGRYLEMTEDDNYYFKIYSKIFNEQYGNTLKRVKNILLDPLYPIIETDGKNYTFGRSTRYKLKDEFFFHETTQMVEENGNYIGKYYRYLNNKKEQSFVRLKFLDDRLNQRITIDNGVDLWVQKFFQLYDEKLKNLSPNIYDINAINKQRKILKLKFAKELKEIREGLFNSRESESNHRFNSVFTRVKREIRPFIRINGEEVIELDVKSSQPYFLNCIFTSKFFTSNDTDSLLNIFPEFYKEVLNTKKVIKVDNYNLNFVWNNKLFISSNRFNKLNKDFKYKLKDKVSSYSIIINKIKYYYYNNIELLFKGVPPHPYMCGEVQNIEDLSGFRNIPYHFDFYTILSRELKGNYDRSFVKDQIQLFFNMKWDRNCTFFLRQIRENYPNVNRLVECFQKIKFTNPILRGKYKNPFSLLLQRVESYYFLQIGVKNLCTVFPKESLITVHDAVIVRKSIVIPMERILRESIEVKTGIKIGITAKSKDPFKGITDLVDEYFSGCKL